MRKGFGLVAFSVGFTGTQAGMNKDQKEEVENLLTFLKQKHKSLIGIHGDCIGADADFHDICVKLNIPVTIHPPKNPKKRAFKKAQKILPEKEYLERNHEIVKSSMVLIATPKETIEQLRSGTWATIRYAKKTATPIFLVLPTGIVRDL